MQVGQQGNGSERDLLRNFRLRFGAHLALSIPWILRSAAVVLLASAINSSAQTGQGAIGGSVRDKSGASLAGAEIDIVSEATGVHQRTVTNQSGLFQVQALNPGLYTVVVQQKGFERVTTRSVNVSGVDTTPLDIVLPAGAVTESVTVSADADLLTKTESNVTTTGDHAIVQNLPYPE